MKQRIVPRAWGWMVAETAIVVTGILIAFSLNSWWEGRSAAAREQAHLHALRADFEQNVELLEFLTEFQDRVLDGSAELLMVARGHRSAPPDSVERLMSTVFSSNRFDAVMGAYEGLVGSGGLTQIRDDSLRTALARFASGLDSRYAEQFSTAVYLDFNRAFVGRLGWADGVLFGELRDGRDGEDRRERTWNPDVLDDPAFHDHLALRYLAERDVRRTYAALAEQARTVLERIESQIR